MFWITGRIIRCHCQIWIPNNGHWSLLLPISPTLRSHHVGSSDPEAWIPAEKTCSGTWSEPLSDVCFPIVGQSEPTVTGSLQNAMSQILTHILKGRIIRVHWHVYPTLGYSDYPSPLCFAELVQFSVSLSSFFVFCFARAFYFIFGTWWDTLDKHVSPIDCVVTGSPKSLEMG